MRGADSRRTEEREALIEQVCQLQQALESHAVIDQATGVIMTLGGCERKHAFTVLRETSQRSNTKLRVVALELTGWTSTGVMDEALAEILAERMSHHCPGRWGTRGTAGPF
ncbi:ANTAR domain-containing protein [Streptomyces sp. 549]|uniref:ANTAR domain-containing protein n=1 Tax=Streptomyces sp. 549 TaxID=3049076 RepID=UPI0024C28B20|nr:ANTAR domain-containing protein [Streptomyces sp. 549]MDK1475669.1 ANTAR domain-containing protein [Streptomyces sp. 549]